MKPTTKIDWRFAGSSYNCQIATVRDKSDHFYRFFWAGAIRTGGWRGSVSGWDVWEADAAGCLIEYVGKKLPWDEVDQAVLDYLKNQHAGKTHSASCEKTRNLERKRYVRNWRSN